MSIDEAITTGLRLYANDLIRIGSSGPYINNREVTQRFRVEPGHYLIIPSTYDEDVAHEFMLRIFTEQQIQLKYRFCFLFVSLKGGNLIFLFSFRNLKDYKRDLNEENISFEESEIETHISNKKNRVKDKKECNLM